MENYEAILMLGVLDGCAFGNFVHFANMSDMRRNSKSQNNTVWCVFEKTTKWLPILLLHLCINNIRILLGGFDNSKAKFHVYGENKIKRPVQRE